MTLKRIILSLFISTFLGTTLLSCGEDEPIGNRLPEIESFGQIGYVLNSGSKNIINATLTVFDASASKITPTSFVFMKQNAKEIGNTGNSILQVGNSIYIAVTNSNTLFQTDLQGRIKKQIALRSPRCMATDGTNIYVSKYGGEVTKLTANLDSITSFEGGHNLEGIAYLNNKIYVCDTYDEKYNYYKEVFEIDAQSMKKIKSIEVALNPTQLKAYNNKLYLLSNGNYGNVGYMLQQIDPATGEVTPIAPATAFLIHNNKVYIAYQKVISYTPYKSDCQLSSFDLANQKIDPNSFIKRIPKSFTQNSISKIGVNPSNGDFYFLTSNFKENGDVYRYSSKGDSIETFDTGGINPIQILFVNK